MTSGFVGIACLDVNLPGSATLKDRRSALARVRRGLIERFGAAVADVGDLDTARRGSLTAVVVARSEGDCDRRLAALEAWTEACDEPVAVRLLRVVTPEDLA